MIQYIFDRTIYEQVVTGRLPRARHFVWLGTADIKDLHVHKGKRFVPFLELLSDLIEKGVALRLLHAREPGPRFRNDFDRYPLLISGLERMLCPRVHFKSIIIDGEFAYSGSANLTGAGCGAKGVNTRNFEGGFITTDRTHVQAVMAQFDQVWMGAFCDTCRRKAFCSEHLC